MRGTIIHIQLVQSDSGFIILCRLAVFRRIGFGGVHEITVGGSDIGIRDLFGIVFIFSQQKFTERNICVLVIAFGLLLKIGVTNVIIRQVVFF